LVGVGDNTPHTLILSHFKESVKYGTKKNRLEKLNNRLFADYSFYFHFKRNPYEGFLMENKPKVKLVGENGNVFNLMGLCSRALKNAGQQEKATEMCEKITKSGSYNEALAIMMEYCDCE
jgi:hypothetical protein